MENLVTMVLHSWQSIYYHQINKILPLTRLLPIQILKAFFFLRDDRACSQLFTEMKKYPPTTQLSSLQCIYCKYTVRVTCIVFHKALAM